MNLSHQFSRYCIKCILLMLVFNLTSVAIQAQSYVESKYQYLYGSGTDDEDVRMVHLDNGDLITMYNANNNLYLQRTDPDGNIKWLKRYIASNAILEGLDMDVVGKNVVIGAYKGNPPFTPHFYFAVRLLDGAIQWQRQVNISINDPNIQGTIDLIRATIDGGFVIMHTSSSISMIKCNSYGIPQWARRYPCYSTVDPPHSTSVEQDIYGNYVVSIVHGHIEDGWDFEGVGSILTMDSNGIREWSGSIVHDDGRLSPRHAHRLYNGRVVWIGDILLTDALGDIFFLRLSPSGSIEVNKEYSSSAGLLRVATHKAMIKNNVVNYSIGGTVDDDPYFARLNYFGTLYSGDRVDPFNGYTESTSVIARLKGNRTALAGTTNHVQGSGIDVFVDKLQGYGDDCNTANFSFNSHPGEITLPADLFNFNTYTVDNVYYNNVNYMYAISPFPSSDQLCFIEGYYNDGGGGPYPQEGIKDTKFDGNIWDDEASATSETKIILYPNPAKQFVELNVVEGNAIPQHIEIYSLTNQLIRQERLESNSIDISNIDAGTYFIKISDRNHQLISTEKLIKIE